jgi:glycosyltransferase involved in cell wall biosynthesis
MSSTKVLVFAHVPPPHHGQSQMVKHLVEGLKDGQRGIEIYHVDARVSANTEDIGKPRRMKALVLVKYVAQAWYWRFRSNVRVFYYIPSPPKRVSLYRDWLVLGACRLVYPHLVFHWHAVGLGEWLRDHARPWERRISSWLLDAADLSITLSEMTSADAGMLAPKAIEVVPNGIVDPCPDFDSALRHRRTDRESTIQRAMPAGSGEKTTVTLLYLSLCTADKGVLDSVRALICANNLLQTCGSGVRLKLRVAGEFISEAVRREFDQLSAESGAVEYIGFLNGPEKAAEFRNADVFLFPSYYANEGQPLSLVEAMAWGLPVVTTRWRGIPELVPAEYPGLVAPRDPEGCARGILAILGRDFGGVFRERFLSRYTINRHLDRLAEVLRSVPI